MGGVHPSNSIEIDLDTLSPPLEKDKIYDLAVFHAERQNFESNFKITTSIRISSCPPGTVPSCWPNCSPPPSPPP